MTPSKSKTGRPYTYDWDGIGETILAEYRTGASIAVLVDKHRVGRKAISYFLAKHKATRTRKDASRVRTLQGRDNTAPKDAKTCKHCTQLFVAQSGGSLYCSTCVPDRTFYSRFNAYGISKPEWDRLLSEQNGTCALCEEEPKHVDHDHKTDVVRGLLCVHCNLSMARVEKPEWLQRAHEYTKKDTGFRVNPKHKHRKLREEERLRQRSLNSL